MPSLEYRGPRDPRATGLAAAIGGLLWIPYGVFEMLQPWGEDTEYRDDRGYEIITDALLYRVYALPGGLALLLTSAGLLGIVNLLATPTDATMRVPRWLGLGATVLAVLCLIGAIVGFDPLFTGPRIFGTLALGTATLLAGMRARRSSPVSIWRIGLIGLGLLGLFLFPLWPLVNAIEIVPEAAGAATIALFGLGWVLTGYRLLFPRASA